MVVFTCNHCGESLQKPKVEKHYQFGCRAVKNLTCVDCFKDFKDEEYVVHIKCITEEERYSAKGSIPNGIVKKGEVKQESWVEMIKSILDKETNMLPGPKNLLNAIANFSNVTRKKAKFINFVKSSSGGRTNMKDIEAVWDIIEKYKISNKPATNGNANDNKQGQKNENGTEGKKRKVLESHEEEPSKKNKKACDENGVEEKTEEVKTKKSKKRKHSENGTEIEEPNEHVEVEIKKSKKKKNKDKTETNGDEAQMNEVDVSVTKKSKKNKKNGIEEIQSITEEAEIETKKQKNKNLTLAENGTEEAETNKENGVEAKFGIKEAILSILEEKPSITLKKLEKKFLKLYTDKFGEVDLEKISKKFNKKLKNIENVVVSDNKVSYVSEKC